MQDYVSEFGKASPPIAISGISFMGISLPDWAYIVTIIYTILLLLNFFRKMIFSYRQSDKDPACAEDCPVAKRAKHQ